jgi:hypothetical protein
MIADGPHPAIEVTTPVAGVRDVSDAQAILFELALPGRAGLSDNMSLM